MFSFGVIPGTAVLTGDDARAAYEAADKEGALMIQLDKTMLQIRKDKKLRQILKQRKSRINLKM